MSRDAVEFYSATYQQCKNDLVAFRNKNRASARDARYFDWRYLGRPSVKEPVIVWAVGRDGAPAGSLSLVPHEFSVDGRPRFMGVLGDISVCESMRGQGIAGRMLGYLAGLEQVRELDACVVLPNEEASRSLAKAGWSTRSCLERHLKPLDLGGRIRKKAGGVIASVSTPPLNLLLRLREATVKVPAGYWTETVQAFDERFDELWEAFAKDGLIAGRRDRAYLSWRFARHPSDSFSVFALAEGRRPAGYIVYTAEERDLKVYDLLCPAGGDEADYLVSSFLRMARSLSAASVTIRASAIALRGFDLAKFGFMKRHDVQALMALYGGAPLAGAWHITAGDKDV